MFSKLLLVALLFLATSIVSIEKANAENVDDRMQLLLEIAEPVRAETAIVMSELQALLTTDHSDDTSKVAEALHSKAERAELTVLHAIESVEQLRSSEMTHGDTSPHSVTEELELRTLANYSHLLKLLEGTKAIGIAIASGDVREREAGVRTLGLLSGYAIRDNAQMARARSNLTPEFVWVEPIELAYAELLDGIADLLEHAINGSTIASQASLKERAESILRYTQHAERRMANMVQSEELQAFEMFEEEIRFRLTLLHKSHEVFLRASEATDAREIGNNMTELRRINREFLLSQQRQLGE